MPDSHRPKRCRSRPWMTSSAPTGQPRRSPRRTGQQESHRAHAEIHHRSMVRVHHRHPRRRIRLIPNQDNSPTRPAGRWGHRLPGPAQLAATTPPIANHHSQLGIPGGDRGAASPSPGTYQNAALTVVNMSQRVVTVRVLPNYPLWDQAPPAAAQTWLIRSSDSPARQPIPRCARPGGRARVGRPGGRWWSPSDPRCRAAGAVEQSACPGQRCAFVRPGIVHVGVAASTALRVAAAMACGHR